MYAQHEIDVVEWLSAVRWSCRPTVSPAVLAQVMDALVNVGVLQQDELLPPAALLSSLTSGVEPEVVEV